MEVIESIKTRKSIRGYLPTPVPKDILTQILEIATCAPSNDNAQPWGFPCRGRQSSGRPSASYRGAVSSRIEPHWDLPIPAFTGIYRDRQVELGKTLFGLMDIARKTRRRGETGFVK